MARSNSAKTPIIWNIASPTGWGDLGWRALREGA
jgi:hypothetical protein